MIAARLREEAGRDVYRATGRDAGLFATEAQPGRFPPYAKRRHTLGGRFHSVTMWILRNVDLYALVHAGARDVRVGDGRAVRVGIFATLDA